MGTCCTTVLYTLNQYKIVYQQYFNKNSFGNVDSSPHWLLILKLLLLIVIRTTSKRVKSLHYFNLRAEEARHRRAARSLSRPQGQRS